MSRAGGVLFLALGTLMLLGGGERGEAATPADAPAECSAPSPKGEP